ncbi:hypothetical protein CANDROIZ_220019 [Candidatus Roizmanbacteria bacterium]|nr:hypothetical protein CANDROIZ_220019 [Candidatus Roizmanbacteria bacterium]
MIFRKIISAVIEKNIIIKPIAKTSLIPSFLAINNPPPIVKIHAGHITYDRICY